MKTKILHLLVFSCFTLFSGSGFTQMRQAYFDPNEKPDNEVKKFSFFSASEGFVGFSNWD